MHCRDFRALHVRLRLNLNDLMIFVIVQVYAYVQV